MPRLRVLVVEDDHFQRGDIISALQSAAPRHTSVEAVEADSEFATMQILDRSVGAGVKFDAFVVDLHLPWVQADVIPPMPAEVRQGGPLEAGFRLAKRIAEARGALSSSQDTIAPIMIYTVDDGAGVLEFNRPDDRQYVLIKEDDDQVLAERLMRLLD